MNQLSTLFLGIGLIACSSFNALHANGILGSSKPVALTGSGEFGHYYSSSVSGFSLSGGGSNGVDSLGFSMNVGPASKYVPGGTLQGTVYPFSGNGLGINGYIFREFSYFLGAPGSYFEFFDPVLEQSAKVPVLASFHVTSFEYVYDSGFESYEGTFSLLPYAPVPEPSTLALSALVLALIALGRGRIRRMQS